MSPTPWHTMSKQEEMFNSLLNSGPTPDEIELIEQLSRTTKTTKASSSQQRRTHKLFGPLPIGDLTKHAALARSSHGEHVSVCDAPLFLSKYMTKGAAKRACTSAAKRASTAAVTSSSALDSCFQSWPANDMQPEIVLPTMASTSQQTITPSSRVQQSADALLETRRGVAALHDKFITPFAPQTLQKQPLPVSQGPSQLHCSAQAQLSAPAWQGVQHTQRETSTLDAATQVQGIAMQSFTAEAALHPTAHSMQPSHTHASLQQAAAGLTHSAFGPQGQQVDTSPVELQLLADLGNGSAAMDTSCLTVQVTKASSHRSAAFGQKLVRQPMSPGTPDQADAGVRQRRRLVRARSSDSEAMTGNQGGKEDHDVIDLTQDDEMRDAAEMGNAEHSMQHSMSYGQLATGRSRCRKRGREVENAVMPPAKKVELSSLEDREIVWAQYLNWPHWPAKVLKLTQKERKHMTAEDVWVVFFDAKRTEGMVPLSKVQRWHAQPHNKFLVGDYRRQLTASLSRAQAALDSEKVVVQ